MSYSIITAAIILPIAYVVYAWACDWRWGRAFLILAACVAAGWCVTLAVWAWSR